MASDDFAGPAYIKYEPERYDELLSAKVALVRERFSEFFADGFEPPAGAP